MNKAIISFGSNIDPDKNLNLARINLQKIATIIKESSFIKTKPIGFLEQNDFLNGIFLVHIHKTREELNSELKMIEKMQGRKHQKNKNGPRTLDLDILVWNGEVLDEDFYKRDFIRKAILEIEPELMVKKDLE